MLYALPTFAWDQSADGGQVTSTRRGGGVRVYLGRSWWSSGDGELLGVVLGASLPSRRDPLYRYSTFWGQDPLWLSPGEPAAPAVSFTNAAGVFRTVQLAELGSQLVTIVGFDVHWDHDRKLWYADLEFDTEAAYYPFVRLALARISRTRSCNAWTSTRGRSSTFARRRWSWPISCNRHRLGY